MNSEQSRPYIPEPITVKDGDDLEATFASTKTPAEIIPHLKALYDWAKSGDLRGLCLVYITPKDGGGVCIGALQSGGLCVHSGSLLLNEYASNTPTKGCHSRT